MAFPTPALACWAGRFTPQVNLAPAALRLEIAGSLRLFGGLPALLRMVREDLAAMDLAAQLAVAATPLAALWLARAGSSEAAICPDLPTTRAALAAVPLSALELAPPLARRIDLQRGEILAHQPQHGRQAAEQAQAAGYFKAQRRRDEVDLRREAPGPAG